MGEKTSFARLTGHQQLVNDVQFSPDDSWPCSEATCRPCTSWPGVQTPGSSSLPVLTPHSNFGRQKPRSSTQTYPATVTRSTQLTGARTDRESSPGEKTNFSGFGG